MRVYVLLEKLPFILQKVHCETPGAKLAGRVLNPQIYHVLPKKISKLYKMCLIKCTPLPLQNIPGWRANSALVLSVFREGDSGGGRFICSASNASPCS